MLRVLLRASTVGIHLVVATFVGLAVGVFLDGMLGTKPWLTFIFLGLGIFTGFRDLFRMAKEAVEETKNETGEDAENTKNTYAEWDDEDEDRS